MQVLVNLQALKQTIQDIPKAVYYPTSGHSPRNGIVNSGGDISHLLLKEAVLTIYCSLAYLPSGYI